MKAPGLTATLGGPQIYLKRDDLTGLALGGNKGRALQYLMTEPIDMGADIILAAGPQQSNWLANLTAAARKSGMRVILFLLKGNNQFQGNLLLEKLMGADFRLSNFEMQNIDAVYEQMDNVARDLRLQGHRPFIFRYGAVAPLGITGYVSLAAEINSQLQENKISAQYLFLGSGSGCTQAGVSLGARLYKSPFKVVGVSVTERRTKEEQARAIAAEANETARFLGIDLVFKPEEFECMDEFAVCYAPTTESITAVKLLAEAEGVFVDPLYTGKVLAALISQIRNGRIRREDTVILYHSGGIPGIFANSEKILV